MEDDRFDELCRSYLNVLCREAGNRSVGSPGNLMATSFFDGVVRANGWTATSSRMDVIDWESAGVELKADGASFNACSSPYSLGCKVRGELAAASTIEQLEAGGARGRVLLVHGELASEQLMPKGFVFYNPDRHRRIVSLLESSGAAALICATGRNSSLAGGAYPFPLIEDGDFNVPSVYLTAGEGLRLMDHTGGIVELESRARRIPAVADNIVAAKGSGDQRIVITAHIDAKKGTPGAIDNATGVTVLLLLSALLGDYSGPFRLELTALNGEDYYSVPGQMQYIRENEECFGDIALNINIDGAGFHLGDTAVSQFDVPGPISTIVSRWVQGSDGFVEGEPWPQGDHSIFVHYGVPAIAVTSKWFLDNIDTQDVTHTDRDNLSIVSPERVVEIAQALAGLIASMSMLIS